MSECKPIPSSLAPTERLAKSNDKPMLNFEAALYEYCRQENVLSTTARNVLQYNKDFRVTLPTVETVVLWSDPAMNVRDRVLDLYRKRQYIQNCKQSQTSSWTQILSSHVMRTVHLLSLPASHAISEWMIGKSDYENDMSSLPDRQNEFKRIEWDDGLVCTQLMFALMQRIEQIITTINETIVLELSDVPEWFDKQRDENLEITLVKLPSSHFELLLGCLQDLDILKLVERKGKPTVCVLMGKQRDLETAITLFDLQQAISGLEACLQRWTLQAEEAKRNAKLLSQKHGGPNKELRIALSRWKLYENHIENAQATLLNLETCREAILNSVSQRESVLALESAAQTLQTLRIENADNIADDLAEEIACIQNDQSILSSNTETYNEEALLDELQNLSINDPMPGHSHNEGTPLFSQDVVPHFKVPVDPTDSVLLTPDDVDKSSTIVSQDSTSIERETKPLPKRKENIAVPLP